MTFQIEIIQGMFSTIIIIRVLYVFSYQFSNVPLNKLGKKPHIKSKNYLGMMVVHFFHHKWLSWTDY